MGEFFWDVGVWSVDRDRMETVSALVDTGASYSKFPRPMLQRLGIAPLERLDFERLTEVVIEYDVGQAQLRVNGRNEATMCVFGKEDDEPLLGANALQEFLLLVDPVGEQLVSRTQAVSSLGKGNNQWERSIIPYWEVIKCRSFSDGIELRHWMRW